LLNAAETTTDIDGRQQSCDGRTTSGRVASRRLTASGKFGDHVMLTAARSVVIIDAKQLTTQCQWNNVTEAGATVWIGPLRL